MLSKTVFTIIFSAGAVWFFIAAFYTFAIVIKGALAHRDSE